ncbi:MAG: alpha/beta hydrolase [Crocinitomicaceae bacterium]
MRIFGFIVFIAALASCKKVNLDGLAFPSEKLESYAFENAEGEVIVHDSILATSDNYTLLTFNSVDANTGEEFQIYGVFIGDTATITTDTLIVYFHGQSKHMDHYFGRASLLAHVGGKYNYNVLMMDYRGYGMSEGTSTEQGLFEDADAVIDWIKGRGADPQKTVFYGYSLGAIPSIDRTAYRSDFQPAKLIIEAPLASVEYLVHASTVIQVDPDFVTNLDFENAEKIKDVDEPLLWMHGVEDTYVAIENGEIIYNNHGGSVKQAERVEGSDHSEVPIVMGIDVYLEKVLGFIRN